MSAPPFGLEDDDRRRPRPEYGYGAPQPAEPAGAADGAALDPAGGEVPELPSGGGADAVDRDPFGQDRPGQGPFAQDQYGQGSSGSDPYGQVAREPAPTRPAGPAAGSFGVPDSEEAPVCPRHPDRVSYVRCQRCHRPACPECQRPAPVGVLCVDCARDAARRRQQAAPRTALGGAMTGGRPIVTLAIIALCALAFGLQTVAPSVMTNLFAFAPFRALAMPWTFLTSGFLHGGLLHLALNMYALWIVGGYLERTMGRWRYAGVFLVSVLAGHVAVLLFSSVDTMAWFTPTVGASGGIFGLFGSLFVVNRRMGAQSGQVIMLIIANLAITFLVPNISWQGHLGGLVLGTATTAALFALRPKAVPGADRVALARRSALIHAAVLGAAVLLCLALIVVRVMSVPAGSMAMG